VHKESSPLPSEVRLDRRFYRPPRLRTFETGRTTDRFSGVDLGLLLGTEDKAIPPALQRFMAERANATIVEVPASHVSFASQPEAATQLILQAVEDKPPPAVRCTAVHSQGHAPASVTVPASVLTDIEGLRRTAGQRSYRGGRPGAGRIGAMAVSPPRRGPDHRAGTASTAAATAYAACS
jgi:hypothetical protein